MFIIIMIISLLNYQLSFENLKFKKKFEKYNTGRIDIINKGNKNNVLKILNISDDFISLTFPKWF